MDIATIALNFKKELEQNPNENKVNEIAEKIQHLGLTDIEIDHVLNYIKYPMYDHTTGTKLLHEGDNSKFLNLVALLASKIKRK